MPAHVFYRGGFHPLKITIYRNIHGARHSALFSHRFFLLRIFSVTFKTSCQLLSGKTDATQPKRTRSSPFRDRRTIDMTTFDEILHVSSQAQPYTLSNPDSIEVYDS
ncbi:hypothetical protein J3R74_002467 [Puniceicoccus vermicola]